MQSLASDQNAPMKTLGLFFGATAAVVLPALLAWNLPPSATFLNQAAAVIGWGVLLTLLTKVLPRPEISSSSGLMALLWAIGLLNLAVLGAWVCASLPTGIALTSVGMLCASAVAATVGATAVQHRHSELAMRCLCRAFMFAGLLSFVVSLIQVFVPAGADGTWIAMTALPGRASGNLRQPNHLGSLLLWSIIAAIWLAESGALRRDVMAWRCAMFVFALVLTGSRTAMLGVMILALWGALDRQLSRRTRVLLLLIPLFYALCWLGLMVLANDGQSAVVDPSRFSTQRDISSSRFGLWSDTVALIARHPWFGVGWGGFNFAWSLTPSPNRSSHFFSNAHNLPLQFAVELGLPLAAVVLTLLCRALWLAFAVARNSPHPCQALQRRCAFVMVLLIGLHSLFEYPLWYAYFLLPTSFMFGLCVGEEAVTGVTATESSTRSALLRFTSLVVVAAGVVSVFDYMSVTPIFRPGGASTTLNERVARGQRSWFFAYHADYVAATTAIVGATGGSLAPFASATHHLLDTRLMIAWAQALNNAGATDQARYLAQRLREFRNPDATYYFEPCNGADNDDRAPYQCTLPERPFDYREFQ